MERCYFNHLNSTPKFVLSIKIENIDFPEENGAEFDSWMWIDYAEPPKLVVDFKKKVYTSALLELAPFIFSSSALDKVRFKLSL